MLGRDRGLLSGAATRRRNMTFRFVNEVTDESVQDVTSKYSVGITGIGGPTLGIRVPIPKNGKESPQHISTHMAINDFPVPPTAR